MVVRTPQIRAVGVGEFLADSPRFIDPLQQPSYISRLATQTIHPHHISRISRLRNIRTYARIGNRIILQRPDQPQNLGENRIAEAEHPRIDAEEGQRTATGTTAVGADENVRVWIVVLAVARETGAVRKDDELSVGVAIAREPEARGVLIMKI
jgi:hypothetical protein